MFYKILSISSVAKQRPVPTITPRSARSVLDIQSPRTLQTNRSDGSSSTGSSSRTSTSTIDTGRFQYLKISINLKILQLDIANNFQFIVILLVIVFDILYNPVFLNSLNFNSNTFAGDLKQVKIQ